MANRFFCCCGCVVRSFRESDFLKIDGEGDFADFLPETTFITARGVSGKLESAAETFLRLNRCGPNEHLVVRLIADAELVNNGTEDEPDYAIGDHLFVELQTPVASGLVDYSLNPLWVIRVGAVVDGDTLWLAQQAHPTLHPSQQSFQQFEDAIALIRGELLLDWTDSRKLFDGNGQYTMQTLAGDVQLSTLHGARVNKPAPILPVAYLASRDATVISGGSSVDVARGKIFRLKRIGLNPNVISNPSQLSSWEVVDREDMPTRSLLMGYGRRGVNNVATWNAIRIEETEEWPDHGHIGVQCLEDEPVSETVFNATLRNGFYRSDLAGESNFQSVVSITASGPPDEDATQVKFFVQNLASVIGADLLLSSDLDAAAYEVAVVESQTISGFAVFDEVFDGAPENAKATPPITPLQGHRIDVFEAVLAIAAADPDANALDVLVRMAGSGSAKVGMRLALRYPAANPVPRAITGIGVRETTVPLSSYCVDADPTPWWHTIVTETDGDIANYPAVTITPSFDPAALTDAELDVLTGQVPATTETGGRTEPWVFESLERTITRFTAGGRMERIDVYRYSSRRREGGVGSFEISIVGLFRIGYRVDQLWVPGGRRSIIFVADIPDYGVIAFSNPQIAPYDTEDLVVTTNQWSIPSGVSDGRRAFFQNKSFTATFADAMLD